MADELLDSLRFVALLEGGFVLGLSFFVLRLYMYARGLAQLSGRGGVGAPPYHVSAIALSHMVLVTSAMWRILAHLKSGSTLAWYGTPSALIAFSLSLVGLVSVLRHENAKISAIKHGRKPV